MFVAVPGCAKEYEAFPRQLWKRLIHRRDSQATRLELGENQRRKMSRAGTTSKCFRLLSELLVGRTLMGRTEETLSLVTTLGSRDFEQLWALANSHHVLLRSFPTLQQLMAATGNSKWEEWTANAVEKERSRIGHAMSFLEPISQALEQCGKVIVIKSLDHWPDLGSDLDLYTNASAADVIAAMRTNFGAQVAKPSWGDRLAKKWNFAVPGLPELVEIHVGRLGQTGEQTAMTESLTARARLTQFAAFTFRVPATEDRVVISTLQRMYRHFYIRLCDIVDNVHLAEAGTVDYLYLRTLAQSAGLWEGVATYLGIVSDYVRQYRGEGIPLPSWLTSEAQFGLDKVGFSRNWLRIPIVPHSARLYAAEWRHFFRNGEMRNTLRLTLLPCLASAAALQLKLTGSDKGIW